MEVSGIIDCMAISLSLLSILLSIVTWIMRRK